MLVYYDDTTLNLCVGDGIMGTKCNSVERKLQRESGNLV